MMGLGCGGGTNSDGGVLWLWVLHPLWVRLEHNLGSLPARPTIAPSSRSIQWPLLVTLSLSGSQPSL